MGKQMKKDRKYSIVVPTRNRADTLYFCLKTCMAQQYDNLEILVCNNSSDTKTQEVVQTLQQQDPRIRCVTPPKTLGMTSNWNFAMEHVSGDFVTFVGDDDGLLSNAVSSVNRILEIHDVQAVVWQPATFGWPTSRSAPNRIAVLLNQKSFLMNSKILITLIARNLTSCGRAPMVYRGFVSTEAMRRLKVKTGRYFWSCSPDVYSGYALLSEFDNYYYTFYPLGVHGASGHSNGEAYLDSKTNKQQSTFLAEHDIPFHPKMRPIAGGIHSGFLEALLEANDRCFQGKLSIDMASHLKEIVKQVSLADSELYTRAFELLKDLDLGDDFQKKILKWKKEFFNPNPPIKKPPLKNGIMDRTVLIDTTQYGIENIEQACQFIRKLFPDYEVPRYVPSVSVLVYGLTLLHRKFKSLLDAYLFE